MNCCCLKRESLLKGLKQAIDENIISSKWEEKLIQFTDELDNLATDLVLSDSNDSAVSFEKVLAQYSLIRLCKKYLLPRGWLMNQTRQHSGRQFHSNPV